MNGEALERYLAITMDSRFTDVSPIALILLLNFMLLKLYVNL